MDDRYVGFREHAAAQQRTDAELARLRERQATTEATLLHEVAAVRADVSEVKQLMLRGPQQQPDQFALAMHHVGDALREIKSLGVARGGIPGWMIALMVIGALAVGAMAMRIVYG